MASGGAEVTIAVVQFAPTTDAAANLHVIRDLATLAASRGAELVVFPEYSSYFEETMTAESIAAGQPLDGPFVAALQSVATSLGVYMVAGLLEVAETSGRVHNTVVAVAPDDGLIASYRKLHLYDAFGQRESDLIEAGSSTAPQTFDALGLTFGLQTCYDIRFPEVSRRLVDAGSDVLLVPSEWVRGPLKEAHWRTLLTARAIENTVYVAAADHAPPIGVGNSMIVDPMGVEVATIGEDTGVALGWVSGKRITEVRRLNPALALRRFSVVPRTTEG